MDPRPFAERVRAPRVWTFVAFRVGRGRLALAFAAIPALVFLLVALQHPPFADPERLRSAFSRYISGLITAATIAVGFATLSLQRAIKGIGEIQEHVEADREFGERVLRVTGLDRLPATVGGILAATLDAVRRRADELGETKIARHAAYVAEGARRANGDPERLLLASTDLDPESLLHEVRARVRDGTLEDAIEAADIARSYVKTLTTQWGLSRMSQAIALAALLAVVVATGVVLGAEPATWMPWALAAALFAVLLPLAIFVSFALRFTFLNQHSLPIGPFVLGPENEQAAGQR